MRPVTPLEQKLGDWNRHRRRLELETRLLVVDDEAPIRRQLDDLLYRLRISSRSAVSSDQAMDLLGGGAYPLLLVSESLSGMGGLYLVRQVRRAHPAVDALVSSWEPSPELLSRAFDLRLLDVVRKPLPERQAIGEQIRSAIRRNVDRRMRRFLVQELHASLEELTEKVRVPTTRLLEQRLTAFKNSLGAFNRVLVVERDDADLRLFSESLLLAGLHVETAQSFAGALTRIKTGELHMIVFHDSPGAELRAVMSELRAASPLLEVLLVSRQPDVERARSALMLDAAGYVPWPPAALPSLVNRVQAMLRRSRRERLLDNLVVELFRETTRALGFPPLNDSFPRFCQLVGMERVAPELAAPLIRAATGEAVEFLDDVLDSLLSPEDGMASEPNEVDAPAPVADSGSDRRSHPRVLESQFVRFRTKAAPASNLAVVGDLSEGGLFIRTAELLPPGMLLELEFQVVHLAQRYMVCCRAQVAWVARDNRQSALGPGFGVKFIDAPDEVVGLLQRIVDAHIGEQS